MKKLIIVVVISLSVFSTPVLAGMITVTFNGVSGDSGQFSINSGTTWTGTRAGSFTMTVTNDTGMDPFDQGKSYEVYCVDLNHWVSSPIEAQTDNMADWTMNGWPKYSDAPKVAAYLLNTYAGSANTPAKKGGLALAIWEVLYENYPSNGYILTTGVAQFRNWNTNYVNEATNYLGLATGKSDAIWVVTDNPDSTHGQDYGAHLPEPATLLLIGSGLLGFVGLRRRFKK